MVLMALRAMTAHILSQICAVVFTSPLTSRLCSQLQELQELPTSPLRMWSSSKKHQLILTLAPGPGVEPGSRGHEADALPLSYPHTHPAVVHSGVHALADVDLDEIAQEQPAIDEEPTSSLKLVRVDFPGVENPVVCDTSLGRPRVLVLERRRRAIFEAIHELAHASGRSTLAIIAKSYVWRNMRQDVRQWACQCEACAASKVARHVKPEALPIAVPSERFTHVHFDIVGPFTPDQGQRYLLTMIDRTTKWSEAVPMADTTMESVVQAFLSSWVSRFGIPITVTTDRGAQFTSETWRAVMGRLGVTTATTTAYHPQANGMVERFHRTVKSALRCAVRTSKSWLRSVPWVLLGLGNAPKAETATSTAVMVFGTPLRVLGLCFQDAQSPKRLAAEQLELARTNVRDFTPDNLNLRCFKASPFVAKSLRTAAFVYVRDDRFREAEPRTQVYGPVQGRGEGLGEQHVPCGSGFQARCCILDAIKGGNHVR